MVRPLVYSKRATEAEKRAKRRAAQQRWLAQNHEILLRKKREWARRPETLARRRELYRLRKEGAGGTGMETQVQRPTTLDAFAKTEAPHLDHRMCSSLVPKNMAATGCLKPALLFQRPSRIVEFHFECLDAHGSVLSSSSETIECNPGDVRDDDPGPDCSTTPNKFSSEQ